MPSLELREYVDKLINVIESDGITVERISALAKASTSAMFHENDIEYSLKCSNMAKGYIAKYTMQVQHRDFWHIENLCMDIGKHVDVVDLYYEILKQESYYNFQSFIYYMEKNRHPKKRFYYPRRRTLHIVVKDLMELEEGKFKFYGLSMPSRVGKSTICIFFLAWIMLRRPNSHSAMCGHSGILAKGFYKEVMNLITSQEYTFEELYTFWHPEHVMIRDKSAEEFTITLDEPDRFATLTCRGIDGTWTGAVDVSGDINNIGYLYVDDLVRDRQHSLSPQRMDDTFNEYLNKCTDRKGTYSRELMVGTLWNVTDPLERIRIQQHANPEYKFRRIPALNEKGESNFDYDVNGFTTKYYLEVKERLEQPEWEAKYMQSPYVREGLLFSVDELRYFDGALPAEPERVVAVIDTAFGGGDSLSMPICADLGDKEKYIVDWVFSKSTQKQTVKAVVNAIIKHGISEVCIEKNNGGALYADSVKKALDDKGCWHCKVTVKSAPVKMSKEDKISGYSDAVKDNFVFILPRRDVSRTSETKYMRSQEYQNAMDELCMYSAQGKNPHDDAPDSLTQLAMFFEKRSNGRIEIPHNPFRSYF